jgi:hypothetical protein
MVSTTSAKKKTYSSVQTSPTTHIELNSDLVYIDHSCRPSLEFDISTMCVRVAHDRDLEEGDELTFFYPSTEWEMEQAFVCKCREKRCGGWIRGAKWLSEEQVEGNWINDWVLEKLKEKWASEKKQNGGAGAANGNSSGHANGAANGTNGEARGEA